jgi:hypothetical protein
MIGASKDAIVERIPWIVSSGRTLEASCKAIEHETGKKAVKMKMIFFWAGKVSVLTLDSTNRSNDNQPMSDHQETILVAVLQGLSVSNERNSAGALIQEGANMLGAKLSIEWLKTGEKEQRQIFKGEQKTVGDKGRKDGYTEPHGVVFRGG